ncbi:MAG: hypothetical protein ACO3LE_10245 [Bdellovibrionota bacterium]
MILGLRDFILACLFLLRSRQRQKWLFSQFSRAFFVGILGLILSFSGLALGFWFLLESFNFESYGAWATGLGLGVIWLLLLVFGAGPITLLLASFYLSNRANWAALNEASDKSFYEIPPKRKISLWRSLALLLVVLIALPFGLIPFLVWINVFVAAYALAQEWIWAVEENFGVRQKSFFYKLGLGLLPAIFSLMPFLGVLILPFLQTASLWTYRRQK